MNSRNLFNDQNKPKELDWQDQIHRVTKLNIKLKKSAVEDFVALCHLLFMLNLMGYPKYSFIDTILHLFFKKRFF